MAEQEKRVATDINSLILQAEVVYEGYKDHKCPRLNVKGYQCQGKTVVRSFSLERRKGTIERLFIGCEHYQGREKGHMFFSIGNIDIPALLRKFGPRRAYVHQDILDAISFSWENEENNGTLKSLTSI